MKNIIKLAYVVLCTLVVSCSSFLDEKPQSDFMQEGTGTEDQESKYGSLADAQAELQGAYESSPTIIPDEQMARFRFMLDYSEEAICMNSAPLARGEKVRVVKGPLTGLVGELVTVDGRSKIAVRLNMLGCACADMPVGYVEKIENQVAV